MPTSNFKLSEADVDMGKTSKVKGSQVRKNRNGVEPIFSISILPRTMSLPMVCEPLPWTYVGSDNMGLTALQREFLLFLIYVCGGYSCLEV